LFGRFRTGLTIICDGYIISDKTEDGRRSAHYELIWEIPAYRKQTLSGEKYN
jgi:hypothetical protein